MHHNELVDKDITLYGRHVDGCIALVQVFLTTSNTCTTAPQVLSMPDTADQLQPTQHELGAATDKARIY